ncbi:nuclear transport factor 2 family protein [Actinomadura yumaensis]|uniref:Nuclear transport factor 2 family protein n=1 Tax=Actinomadura yumaensis TaxID=111807 RepID=A0ABW2CEB0_9ACTN
MSDLAAPRAVFQRLIDGVTGRRYAELPLLYAEDAVVTHPFAAPASRLVGRAGLRAHFARVPELPIEMRARDVVVHETADPEVIVAEFAYEGRVTTTGRAFTVPNIFVMRVRDGLIVESRDYAHHAAFAEALADAFP